MYSAGGHGFGMRKKNLPVNGSIIRLREWMGERMLTTSRKYIIAASSPI
jgi:hypothetical protein